MGVTSKLSKTHWLIENSTDFDSRMLSAGVLLGRYIAAADGVIDTAESHALQLTFQNRLHLAVETAALIDELLAEGISTNYSRHADVDAILALSDGFDEYVFLHLFAFAASIANADGKFQQEEQEVLAELATIFGIETPVRNAVFSAYCGAPLSSDVSDTVLSHTAQALLPVNLQRAGRSFQALATDNARIFEKFAEAQHRARKDYGAAPSQNNRQVQPGTASTSLNSKITAALESSPLREQLSKLIERAKTIPADILGAQRRDALERLLSTAGDDRFRIAVVGNFSSGKSTFLNALCRGVDEELFPSSSIPCTGTVSILRFGEKPRFFLQDAAGKESAVPSAQFRSLVTLPEDIDRAAALGNPDAAAVIVEYPLNLCAGGVELIDTPGLNENPRRTEITDQYLRQADAVVYLMTATHLLSEQDRNFIDELRNRVKSENLFFVINYFDQVVGTEDEDKVRRRAQSYFKDIFLDNFDDKFTQRVHFLSARRAAQDSAQGLKDSQYVHALNDFELAIGEYLNAAKGEVRWRQKANELMRILVPAWENAQMRSQDSLTNLDAQITERKQALQEIRRAAANIQRAEANAGHAIEQTRAQCIIELINGLSQFEQQLPGMMREHSQHWTSEASSLWGRKQILEDFSEQMKADLHQFLESWFTSQGKEVLSAHIEQMLLQLNKEFQGINEDLNRIRMLSGEEIQVNPKDSDVGAFATFMKGAGGFLAGGPVGMLIGASLDIEDIAINAAANFAMGATLAMFGIGGPVTLILGAALVGGIQLFAGEGKRLNKARAQVVEGGIKALPDIIQAVKENIADQMSELFGQLQLQVSVAVEQKIKDVELQERDRMQMLEQATQDLAKAQEKLNQFRQLAVKIKQVGTELEQVSTLTFDQAIKEAGVTGRIADRKTVSNASANLDVDVYDSEKPKTSISVRLVFTLLLILAGVGGAYFYFA